MKKIIIAIAFLFFIIYSFAQKADSIPLKKNVVYGELLGNAWLCSINYERIIIDNKNSFIAARIGGNGYIFPLLINVVFDKNENNHFELGGGISFERSQKDDFFYDKQREYGFAGTANLMYRYQKPGGKFIFRAGWTPLFWFGKAAKTSTTWSTILFLLTPGISFGYGF